MSAVSSVMEKKIHPLLKVENLTTQIKTPDGILTVLENVNLTMKKGEMMAIVGESGSGKSMTIHSILQVIPKKLLNGYQGKVEVEGTEILSLNEKAMKQIRGRKISLIAQNAMTSLDPSYKVGSQIVEIITSKTNLSKKNAKEKALDLLQQMGIDEPLRIYQSYPHQLSGGLRQRVVIAMSLACDPDLIIADEPTSALDPTVQLQVLDLLKKVNKELGTAVLMITHDFGVVARIAETVAVMYAGQIVEKGRTSEVIFNPKHPYTQSLLKCIPDLTWIFDESKRKQALWQIPGEPPNLLHAMEGCRFADRCHAVEERCHSTKPLLKKGSHTQPDHVVRCLLAEGED
ncbi:ABC transporter ATP-binding protein [Priestia abyssalis]|uniref:ABC transporter ATP-binding protein n=1 Tax=Priestia abyssalis TaxID=1221450 RepID=UPI0009959AB2|nr:ABC transporter ATP-binding protein [Priestia abyssalis]